MGRPKKEVKTEVVPVVEKIQMINSKKVDIAKINLQKFKEKFSTGLPHVMYIGSSRFCIDSVDIEPNSKLYMLLQKEGVLDGD